MIPAASATGATRLTVVADVRAADPADLADRAAAYGFEGVVVDGTDVLAVYREAKRAIEKAREGGGPTLIESVTLRMEGHAVHDDASYVPREMFEELGYTGQASFTIQTHTDIVSAYIEALGTEACGSAASSPRTRVSRSPPFPGPRTVT